jgi:hypothetical protein
MCTMKALPWLLVVMLGMSVRAAPYDETLRVPRVESSRELQAPLKEHFETYQRKQQEADPAAFIRDRVAHKQWSDLHFSITLAMDEKLPLEDLADFGLIAQPDRTYTVDLKRFPQWETLEKRLRVLNNADVLQSFIPELESRGFRDIDVDKLCEYVATHDPGVLRYTEGLELVDTFAQRLQRKRQAGQPPSHQELLVYHYQKASISSEAERQWAVGLLDVLDEQRQRILATYVTQLGGNMMFGLPQDSFEQTLYQQALPLITGDYVRLIEADQAQIQREMEQRAAKLTAKHQP